MPTTAYQVTAEDIENVLDQYSMRVLDTRGQSFAEMAKDLLGEINHERIAEAAMKAGTEAHEHYQAAFDEIHKVLVEMGVLEF